MQARREVVSEIRRILRPGGRYAFVVFTPRLKHERTIWRPISARYMHRKEVARYEKEISGA